VNKKPNIKDRVRLTKGFLRNTGQMAGVEAHSKWEIVNCDCTLCEKGPFVAVNEPSIDNPNQSRHINYHNLEKCR
jgi:hypothetical protein